MSDNYPKKTANLFGRLTPRTRAFFDKKVKENPNIRSLSQYLVYLATLDGFEAEPCDW